MDLDFSGNGADGDVEGAGAANEGGVEGGAPKPSSPLEPGGARFEQVYGRMKEYEKTLSQYKEFGDPNALKERIAKLAQWEKTVEEHRKQASMTPSEQEQAKRTLQLQKELYQVMPSLKLLDKIEALENRLAEFEGKTTETAALSVLKEHSSKLSELLKTNKIDVKHQAKIEDYLGSLMSDEERQQFISGDFSIAENLFNNELKDGLFASMRTKPNLPVPPVRNTPGGTTQQKQGKISSMKDAENEAWVRFSGGE